MRTEPNRAPRLRLRTKAVAISAPVVLALLAGCASSGSTPDATSANTAITVVHANTIATLDPIQAVQAETDTVASLLYDPLVTYDSNNQLVGVIAKSFTTETGATAIDITLNPGITFHDGTPVTAADVQYTFERDLAANTGVASYLAGYKDMTITDDNTFTINLTTPSAFFLHELSKVYILNKKLVQPNEGSDHALGWLQSNDAGSGPYTLSGNSPLTDVVVDRWSSYFNYDATRPSSIDVKEVDNSSTEAGDLKAGTADIALKLSSADATDVGTAPGVTTTWIDSGLSEFIWMNPNSGATADVDVRKALQMVYDYQGGLKAVWDGKGQMMPGILPTTMSCQATLGGYAQNLDQAKQILQAKGITDLTLRYQPALAQFTQEATLFQSNLASIGVTLNLVPIEFSDWLTSLSNQSTIPEMMLMGDVPRFPDTGIYLNYVYNSAAVGTNYSGFSNPQVDALLNQAKTTADDTARCGLEQQAQSIIYDQAISLNMYTYQQPVSYRTGITGVVADPNANPINLRTIRIGN